MFSLLPFYFPESEAKVVKLTVDNFENVTTDKNLFIKVREPQTGKKKRYSVKRLLKPTSNSFLLTRPTFLFSFMTQSKCSLGRSSFEIIGIETLEI